MALVKKGPDYNTEIYPVTVPKQRGPCLERTLSEQIERGEAAG